MGKVIVIGSSNTDMVITSTRIPHPGETVLGGTFSMIPGGKGANQAVAAARAGGTVSLLAKVGEDEFGRKSIAAYRKDGISTDLILTTPDHPSGVAIITVDESTGENSIVVASGANSSLSPDDIRKAEQRIAEADVLLVQLEIPLDTVQLALQIAKENEVKTILNPAPACILDDDLLNLVDIITPNESETHALTGINPVSDLEIRQAAFELSKKVNEVVLITLGARGVYYLDTEGMGSFIPTTVVKATDTTAAGDVFNGYLAAALADGGTYWKAIEIANRAAAISVTRKGAQPSIPYREEMAEAESIIFNAPPAPPAPR